MHHPEAKYYAVRGANDEAGQPKQPEAAGV
jgi:hypothetical protein